jgi:uncharacterized protein (DUF427 family)
LSGHTIRIEPAGKHVRVEVDGVTVADSAEARLLFETGHAVRYYLPKADVRMDLLTPTDTETTCPFKGAAEYWSVDAGEGVHGDLAWSYSEPIPQSEEIAGLIAFYDEGVRAQRAVASSA